MLKLYINLIWANLFRILSSKRIVLQFIFSILVVLSSLVFVYTQYSHKYLISYDSYEALYYLKPVFEDGNYRLGVNGDSISIRSYNRIGHATISYLLSNNNFSPSENIKILKYIDLVLFTITSFSLFFLLYKFTNNFYTSTLSTLLFIFTPSVVFYSQVFLSDNYGLLLLAIAFAYIFIFNKKNNLVITLLFLLISFFRFEYLFVLFIFYLFKKISLKVLIQTILITISLNVFALIFLFRNTLFEGGIHHFIGLYSDDILLFVILGIILIYLGYKKYSQINKILISLCLTVYTIFSYINFTSESRGFIMFIWNFLPYFIAGIFLSIDYFIEKEKKHISEIENYFWILLFCFLSVYHTFYLQHLTIIVLVLVILITLKVKNKGQFLLSIIVIFSLIWMIYSYPLLYGDRKVDIAQVLANNIPFETNKDKTIIYSNFPISTYVYNEISSRYLMSNRLCISDLTSKNDEIIIATFTEINFECLSNSKLKLVNKKVIDTQINYEIYFDNINSRFNQIYYYLFKREL